MIKEKNFGKFGMLRQHHMVQPSAGPKKMNNINNIIWWNVYQGQIKKIPLTTQQNGIEPSIFYGSPTFEAIYKSWNYDFEL